MEKEKMLERTDLLDQLAEAIDALDDGRLQSALLNVIEAIEIMNGVRSKKWLEHGMDYDTTQFVTR